MLVKELKIDKELYLVENKIESQISSENDIHSEIKNFITGPSKRIRSILALLYIKANNKEINNDIINIISAGEIIHNASLLHDDVIDDSELRRGKETIGVKFSPKTAILAGDFLLTKAVKLLLETNNSRILTNFVNYTEKMSNSEINQFLNRGKIPATNEYIEICEGKTASLFEAILGSVAISSNLDEKKAISLAKFFGIYFQIKNDLAYDSAIQDKKNNIKTAIDVFGVEKTNSLLDNYIVKITNITREFENQEYSEALLKLAKDI